MARTATAALAALAAAACAGAPEPAPARPDKPAAELVPKRRSGWDALAPAARGRVAAFAGDYARWLASAKTARRAVASLVALAGARGAEPLAAVRAPAAPGRTYIWMGPGGAAAAIVRVGRRPVEEGVRVVVASVDAPHIGLKQRPVYDAAGFALVDGAPYGDLDEAAWLVHPLALYVYAAASGDAPAVDLALGEAPEDPVFAIPDLLPHLARQVQRDRIVDSPERLDAVAAASTAALMAYLAERGVDAATLERAEMALVPAGPPVFVGVDRALLAGHGHRRRALAYAAVRALVDGDAPHHTAIVAIVSRAAAGGDGAAGIAFARRAVDAAVAALATGDDVAGGLALGRAWRRSAALVAADLGGARNRGVVLDPRADDALPAAVRRAVDAFDAGGVQWQIATGERDRDAPARDLATAGGDVVAFGLPVAGAGAPLELASTLDLYMGYRACAAWFAH
ncbi:MAG: hypothetical protein D6689_12165 [Deltaproteobacteria bacterium]|nr:MAG: hypothetical protein D6689_12165 [Deltaproteobacteria bacterium]